MFAKASSLLAIFAVVAQVANAATPPACVIAAVNTQQDPSDFETVCGAKEVQQYMTKNCGNNLEAAQSYFADQCKENGQSVSGYSSSSTASGSATASASATGKSSSGTHSLTGSASLTAAPYPMGTGASSGFVTATANGSYTAPAENSATGTVPTPTESGIATSTGGASRLGMDIVGMAALGVFGAMLAL